MLYWYGIGGLPRLGAEQGLRVVALGDELLGYSLSLYIRAADTPPSEVGAATLKVGPPWLGDPDRTSAGGSCEISLSNFDSRLGKRVAPIWPSAGLIRPDGL